MQSVQLSLDCPAFSAGGPLSRDTPQTWENLDSWLPCGREVEIEMQRENWFNDSDMRLLKRMKRQ